MSEGVLKAFYNSQVWKIFRTQIIVDRTKADGSVRCELCGKVIVESSDMEIHHKPIYLTVDNYKDVSISLNPKNVKLICSGCHNKEHKRFCGGVKRERRERAVYVVYGAPLSGKAKYVADNMEDGDLVVNIDRLFQAVSGKAIYDKPDNLKYNVFALQNLLIDNIKTRYGNFRTAWIVGGYPEKFRREKLAEDLGAELVFIDADRSTCMYRLDCCNDYRQQHKPEYIRYIDEWFEKYIP